MSHSKHIVHSDSEENDEMGDNSPPASQRPQRKKRPSTFYEDFYNPNNISVETESEDFVFGDYDDNYQQVFIYFIVFIVSIT